MGDCELAAAKNAGYAGRVNLGCLRAAILTARQQNIGLRGKIYMHLEMLRPVYALRNIARAAPGAMFMRICCRLSA